MGSKLRAKGKEEQGRSECRRGGEEAEEEDEGRLKVEGLSGGS